LVVLEGCKRSAKHLKFLHYTVFLDFDKWLPNLCFITEDLQRFFRDRCVWSGFDAGLTQTC
jgi:hypothetical protein